MPSKAAAARVSALSIKACEDHLSTRYARPEPAMLHLLKRLWIHLHPYHMPATYHGIALVLDYVAIVATPLNAQHIWLFRAGCHFIAYKLGERDD